MRNAPDARARAGVPAPQAGLPRRHRCRTARTGTTAAMTTMTTMATRARMTTASCADCAAVCAPSQAVALEGVAERSRANDGK